MLWRLLCGVGPALVACVAVIRPAAASVVVYVAYYDDEHPNAAIPDPWRASADTLFFGNTDSSGVWDGGAIRFQNLGPGPAVLQPGLFVNGFANGASFRIWDSVIGTGLALPPGADLILAQPTTGAFDTSDQPIITDPAQRTNNHPIVHFRLDGQLHAMTDQNQVLNTGGFDPGEAQHISESLPWTQIGVIPEPDGLCAAAAWSLALRRRRAQHCSQPCGWRNTHASTAIPSAIR